MSEMAQVAGDGKRSARALVEQSRGGGPLPLDWAELADMLAFQGVKPDDVIEAGRAVVTDMRYGATRLVAQLENTNQLVALADSAIGRQLAAAGLEFLKAIPEELRGSGTMYTVDAIADSEDRVWFLEANCNSTVHPDAYFGMFEGLFGRAGPPRAVAPQQQGAPMRALPADQVPARMAAARPAALPRGLS
jgi:hypothetical protein